MLYTLGVLAFALGLLGSIALHEVGHLVPAKRFGVKVTQYMVGFGPTLWSRRRGETEYGLKAVPLGGYIRMIGMIPPREAGKRSRWPRRLAELAEDFRRSSRADVEPADGPREFYRLEPWKKVVVMVGGPTMNLLIYLVVTILLLGAVGIKGPTDTVSLVERCVVPAGVAEPALPADGTCPAGTSATPAANVLRPGDRIVAIDGVEMTRWTDTVAVIERSAGRRLRITVVRSGTRQDVSLTPVRNAKYVGETGQTKVAGFIGVGVAYQYERVPLTQIPGRVGTQFGQGVQALGSFPAKMSNLFGTVFEGQARDVDGAVGVVGLGRIGGEVAADGQVALLDKVYFLLYLLAGVNLLLFLFNLVPLLPLDGGHVAGAVLEMVRRRIAALRRGGAGGLPGAPAPPRRPIYVDTAQMVPILYGVAAILLAFTLLVVYADIVKPITLPS